jgi:colicin import membrane protein
MTGGSERKDESVTFSLKELMKLEDQRVDEEKQARETREHAAQMAREAETRRQREELEARERADAEERQRARLREMEEEARREAIQRAAVEQARITVEARTRAEEAERERRHEIEMQRMRAEAVKKPGPGGFIGSALGGAAFSLAICLVMHFAVSKPASDKRIAELDRAVVTAETRADELGRRVEEQKARISDLEKSLATVPVDSTKPSAAPPKTPTPGPAPIKKNGPTTGQKPLSPFDTGAPCDPKDPLCGHIDRAK